MATYNGTTSLEQNTQADSCVAAPYYHAWDGNIDARVDRLSSDTYQDGYDQGFADGEASVTLDTTAPTILIVSPPEGASIGPDMPITFRYSDNLGLRRPMPCIKIKQPDNTYKYELIHDGDAFTPDYSGIKTVVSPTVTQFTVQRRGGWTAEIRYAGVQSGQSIQLVPFGTDTAGNEPA